MWHTQWCRWATSRAFRGLEVLGVAPYSYSKTRAVLVGRLRFGNQRRVVEWLWDGDEFRKSWSSAAVPFPASRGLGALPNGHFVIYDFFTGHSVDLAVEQVATHRENIRLLVEIGG
jgi:hypothetical protein